MLIGQIAACRGEAAWQEQKACNTTLYYLGKMLLILSCAVSSAMLPNLAQAGEDASGKTEIPWIVLDWAPVNIIVDGKVPLTPAQLGNGIVDQELKVITALMPAYQHKFVLANIQRVWDAMASGKNVCYASAIKTPEREKFAYFMEVGVAPPVSIIMRRDTMHDKGIREKSLSLAHLLRERTDLKGFVEFSRSYGSGVDAVLATAPNRMPSVRVANPGELLRALDAGRMDYILEYSMTLEYQRRTEAFKNELVVIPISDVPPLFIKYVACTRNAWGKTVSSDIHKAIKIAARGTGLRTPGRNWITDDLRKQLTPAMDKFYDHLGAS